MLYNSFIFKMYNTNVRQLYRARLANVELLPITTKMMKQAVSRTIA